MPKCGDGNMSDKNKARMWWVVRLVVMLVGIRLFFYFVRF